MKILRDTENENGIVISGVRLHDDPSWGDHTMIIQDSSVEDSVVYIDQDVKVAIEHIDLELLSKDEYEQVKALVWKFAVERAKKYLKDYPEMFVDDKERQDNIWEG